MADAMLLIQFPADAPASYEVICLMLLIQQLLGRGQGGEGAGERGEEGREIWEHDHVSDM